MVFGPCSSKSSLLQPNFTPTDENSVPIQNLTLYTKEIDLLNRNSDLLNEMEAP
jgi:hypothetical protein